MTNCKTCKSICDYVGTNNKPCSQYSPLPALKIKVKSIYKVPERIIIDDDNETVEYIKNK